MLKTGAADRSDLLAWSSAQAAALRVRDWAHTDVDGIADALDDMGRQLQRELTSRLATLLLHVLKEQLQPERSSRSWVMTIEHESDEIVELVVDTPSLRTPSVTFIERAYRKARAGAARETGLPLDEFPIAIDPRTRDALVRALLDAEARLGLPPHERWVEATLRSL